METCENLGKSTEEIRLVKSIEEREKSNIDSNIKHSIEQGKSLMELQKELGISQNKLIELVSISKSTISRYISIAKSEEITSIVNTEKHDKVFHPLEQLQKFNQNQLAKLAKLKGDEFNIALESGDISSKTKEKNTHARVPKEIKDLYHKNILNHISTTIDSIITKLEDEDLNKENIIKEIKKLKDIALTQNTQTIKKEIK